MAKMYDEGGLATDGMDVDPVSGNDIPLGSNAEDVRDDVDAKLSSGEYVVPADVVKYVGVAQLEKLVDKAKAGLEDMGENGRIGGEPVGEAEEVVMTLGGDLNTLDGYATGGMVAGTDIDGIINRVKAAAMKDPSIINMLKAKGIFVGEPQPQGQAQQAAMSQGAVPQQAAPPAIQGKDAPAAFAEGGLAGRQYSDYNADDYKSDFNPYAHTLGFSAETAATGQAPGEPLNDTLTQACPEGQVWDSTTNACVPVEATVPVETFNNNDNDDSSAQIVQDPNQWMKQYDYSNPDTLFEKSMTTMGFTDPDGPPAKKGLLESLADGLLSKLGGGLVGKAMAVGNVAAANANAIILENKGFTDQANKLREQIAAYEKEKGTTGWPDAMKNGKGMAERALKSPHATSIDNWSTNPAERVATPGAKKVTPAVAATGAAAASNQRSRGDRGGDTMNETMAAAQQSRKDATAKKQAASVAKSEKSQGLGPDKPGGRTRTDKETGEKKETFSSKVSRGGGFAKGGFVAPRAEAPTPKAKKNTKKGLGRK